MPSAFLFPTSHVKIIPPPTQTVSFSFSSFLLEMLNTHSPEQCNVGEAHSLKKTLRSQVENVFVRQMTARDFR